MDDKFQPKNKNENEPINDLDSLQVRKLHDAVRLDDRALIKNLLKTKTVHINARDETGQTALHIACDRGNLDLVKWLVKKKAVINICNSQGEPPLYRAAKYNLFLKALSLTTTRPICFEMLSISLL
jgi:ankyrin repeat protein